MSEPVRNVHEMINNTLITFCVIALVQDRGKGEGERAGKNTWGPDHSGGGGSGPPRGDSKCRQNVNIALLRFMSIGVIVKRVGSP